MKRGRKLVDVRKARNIGGVWGEERPAIAKGGLDLSRAKSKERATPRQIVLWPGHLPISETKGFNCYARGIMPPPFICNLGA